MTVNIVCKHWLGSYFPEIQAECFYFNFLEFFMFIFILSISIQKVTPHNKKYIET